MLTENEIRVLEVLNSRLLLKKGEFKTVLGDEPDGVNVAIQRLVSVNCIKVIEPIGEKCYVITRKGSRSLKEAKNPERRAKMQEKEALYKRYSNF